MPVNVTFQPSDALVVVTVHPGASVDEILAAGRCSLTDPRWVPGSRMLCDYRGVADIDTSRGGVAALVEQDRSFAARLAGCRCAVVADRPAVFGLARMWEALSYDGGFEIAVFRDWSEACAWLGVSEP